MAARLAPVLVLAGVVVVGAAGAASATGHHDKPATGHTPIVVCHNVTHNPHIIVVDDDSTKLHAHLAHRTQAQLMDLVEGVDGSAAQIRAACVRPSPTTAPATSTPSPTTTEVTPSTTTTTQPTPTPSTDTPTTQTSQPTSPSPTSSTPTTGAPSSTVAPPEALAYTGFTATLALLGAGLLAAGVALSRKGARREH